jgi:hypothetical protein
MIIEKNYHPKEPTGESCNSAEKRFLTTIPQTGAEYRHRSRKKELPKANGTADQKTKFLPQTGKAAA